MLYTLQDKLNSLIKQYKELKNRATALQTKVDALQAELDALRKENKELEEKLILKKIGETGNQEALKAYIDKIIAEIDQTIKKL